MLKQINFKSLLCAVLLISSAAQWVLAAEELDWLELMPASDVEALLNMPEIEHTGPEAESGFYSPGGLKNQDKNLPEVMFSNKTVPALDGKQIALAGYPVPLETNEQSDYIEFFLVPYPGACIHVPPPPPNQIVLVRYAKGIALPDIYEPLWVEGTLKVEPISNELADAAYAIIAKQVQILTDDE